MTESKSKLQEKLWKLSTRWPELVPLLQNCRSEEDIERAIKDLESL
jgi:hypothetical protein